MQVLYLLLSPQLSDNIAKDKRINAQLPLTERDGEKTRVLYCSEQHPI